MLYLSLTIHLLSITLQFPVRLDHCQLLECRCCDLREGPGYAQGRDQLVSKCSYHFRFLRSIMIEWKSFHFPPHLLFRCRWLALRFRFNRIWFPMYSNRHISDFNSAIWDVDEHWPNILMKNIADTNHWYSLPVFHISSHCRCPAVSEPLRTWCCRWYALYSYRCIVLVVLDCISSVSFGSVHVFCIVCLGSFCMDCFLSSFFEHFDTFEGFLGVIVFFSSKTHCFSRWIGLVSRRTAQYLSWGC